MILAIFYLQVAIIPGLLVAHLENKGFYEGSFYQKYRFYYRFFNKNIG